MSCDTRPRRTSKPCTGPCLEAGGLRREALRRHDPRLVVLEAGRGDFLLAVAALQLAVGDIPEVVPERRRREP
eukprot:gene3502-biopygen3576